MNPTANRVFDLAGSIVTIALVAVVLNKSTGFARAVTAIGNVFTNSINAAQGAP